MIKKRDNFEHFKTNYQYIELKEIIEGLEAERQFINENKFMEALKTTDLIFEEYKKIFTEPGASIKGDEDQRLVFQIFDLRGRAQQEQIRALQQENKQLRKAMKKIEISGGQNPSKIDGTGQKQELQKSEFLADPQNPSNDEDYQF